MQPRTRRQRDEHVARLSDGANVDVGLSCTGEPVRSEVLAARAFG